jgi:hypothetical protein
LASNVSEAFDASRNNFTVDGFTDIHLNFEDVFIDLPTISSKSFSNVPFRNPPNPSHP